LHKGRNLNKVVIPVFIGGHPRSGTTLLGDLVGSHSDCICTPESQFKISVYRRLNLHGNEAPDLGKATEMIKKHWRFRIWALDIAAIPYGEIHSYGELILWFAKSYSMKSSRPDAKMWIDHTPANIQFAGLLTELFPEARFINIIRDGRAVAASIIPLDWGANTIDRAAYSWVENVSSGITAESAIGKDRVLRVRYEDLIRETEITLKKICLFLNLQYQPQMIQGGGFKVPGYTIQQHSLIGKEPDAKMVNAWERKLNARKVEIFESIAGELLLSHGYTLKYSGNARKMNGIEKMISGIQETYRGQIVNKLRRKERKKKGIETAGMQ
jgi:hypothetical protein